MIEPLIIPAKLDSLKIIADYIIEIGNLTQLHPNLTYQLRLAVNELATNIINYAYLHLQKGDIIIQANISAKSVTVKIEDQGIPFDPRTKLLKESQLVKQPLEKRPVGKLGILLAINKVDHFAYERVNGKNINTLTINLEKD